MQRIPSGLTLDTLAEENLRFLSLEFVFPDENADATTQVPYALRWRAEYHSTVTPDITVVVQIEPIGGRLLHIARYPAEY